MALTTYYKYSPFRARISYEFHKLCPTMVNPHIKDYIIPYAPLLLILMIKEILINLLIINHIVEKTVGVILYNSTHGGKTTIKKKKILTIGQKIEKEYIYSPFRARNLYELHQLCPTIVNLPYRPK